MNLLIRPYMPRHEIVKALLAKPVTPSRRDRWSDRLSRLCSGTIRMPGLPIAAVLRYATPAVMIVACGFVMGMTAGTLRGM